MKKRIITGVALAQWALTAAAGADGVPESLARIEGQTTSIEAKVADPVSGLPALRTGLLSALANTTKAVSEVQASVDRLRGPANRVWIAPYWEEQEAGLGPEGTVPVTWVFVLNTGNVTAHVGCTFFNPGGTLLLDRAKSLTIAPGASGFCHSATVTFPEWEPGSGSMMVHSDRPVLVYGFYGNRMAESGGGHVQRNELRLFPVDCSSPAGLEFFCGFAAP